ncbi:MAG: 2TM domain-containing protein [Rhizobiales bacterium]|nr:2TM domain-containing protein [Hyphomicrobiales bacterium]
MLHATKSARRRGFQIHAFVFVPSIIFLAVLNFILGAPYWFEWPLLGWSLGLLTHWWFALGPGSLQAN